MEISNQRYKIDIKPGQVIQVIACFVWSLDALLSGGLEKSKDQYQ